MQQFFLFCTMLNVASEAFSKELHGNQVSASVKRKFSRFAPKNEYPNPRRYMFDDLILPMFFVPISYEVPDYGAPFIFPVRRRVLRRGRFRSNGFLSRRMNLSSRKRFEDRFLKKRKREPPWPFDVADSHILNSPQCFEKQRLPDLQYEPYRQVNSAFGAVSDSQSRAAFKYPNQYIVCVYPVFNDKQFRLKKRTLRSFKKRRFSALKGQYLNNLANKSSKNKRSANATTTTTTATTTTTDATASTEDKPEVTSEEYFENLPPTPSPVPPPQDIDYPYDSVENNNLDFFPVPLSYRHSYHSKFPLLPLPNMYTSFMDPVRPTVPLPKINFKYPYDPEIYESSLRNDPGLLPSPKKKESSALEGKTEDKPTLSAPPDLGKLKAMLKEVEMVLKTDEDQYAIKNDTKTKCRANKENWEKRRRKKKRKKKLKSETEVIQGNLKEKIDSVVIPILSKISKELGKLSQSECLPTPPSTPPTTLFASSSSNSTIKEVKQPKIPTKKYSPSERCSTDGTWTSSVLGMEMTFTTMPNMMLKVKITSKKDTVINSKWSIHGLTLSKRGGPLMLAAVCPQKRKIASFIGQCKICRNQDLIFGSWTIYTCVRRFSDLWRAVDTRLDILKKESGTV